MCVCVCVWCKNTGLWAELKVVLRILEAGEKVTEGWRKLLNEGVHNLYSTERVINQLGYLYGAESLRRNLSRNSSPFTESVFLLATLQ